MSDNKIKEIEMALHALRAAFEKANIPCPDVLRYSDGDDRNSALSCFRYEIRENVDSMLHFDAAQRNVLNLVGFEFNFNNNKTRGHIVVNGKRLDFEV